MDQLLNQYYYQQQQDAMNRQSNAMNSILGMDKGPMATPSLGQAGMQGLSGYLTSDAFGKNLNDIFNRPKDYTNQNQPKSKGYADDYNYQTGGNY